MWAGLTSRLVDHEIFLVTVTEMVIFCTLYIGKKNQQHLIWLFNGSSICCNALTYDIHNLVNINIINFEDVTI